jgi:hypothetical protein
MYAEAPGAVGCRLHHAALVTPATDDQELDLSQLRVMLAADFDKEGVEIHVDDACRHAGAYTRRIAVALNATTTRVPAFNCISCTD